MELNDFFETTCKQGFENKLQHIRTTYGSFTNELEQEYKKRLYYELDIIKKQGLPAIFLL